MKSHAFKIDLGVNAKSNINGFKGMVVSRSQHLNGCDRYWLVPKIKKDGEFIDGYWFDEGELIVESKPKLKRTNNDNGGFASKSR